MKIHRPLWNEGALLAPQQFQQQSEWDAFSRVGIAARGNAFPWGVGRVELDDAMLASGRVQAQSLRLWLGPLNGNSDGRYRARRRLAVRHAV